MTGSGTSTPDATPAPVEEPGVFPVDCAKPAYQTTPHCARPSSVPAGSVGSGPAIVSSGLGTVNDGFIDGNRLIATVAYSATPATGHVFAVDLETGNRTIISGSYEDPATGRMVVGSGPDWGTVNDVQPGPDGWYAITSLGVYRVDPATGARTLVIDAANTASRCTVGTTKAIPRKSTLAVGPDKTIFLALSNSPAGTGTGVVAVKAGVCRIVSLGGGPAGSAVGSGATMTNGYFSLLRFRDAKVWGVELLSQSLMTVDPTTGARVRLSSSGASPLGSGDAEVGVAGFVFPLSGSNPVYTSYDDGVSLSLTRIDPTTANRSLIPLVSGPAIKGRESYPPLWKHPSKEWLLVALDNAIVEIDIATGASYTLSR